MLMQKGSLKPVGFLLAYESNSQSGVVRPFVNWAKAASKTQFPAVVFLHSVGTGIVTKLGAELVPTYQSLTRQELLMNIRDSGCRILVSDDYYRRLRLLGWLGRKLSLPTAVYVQVLHGRHSVTRYSAWHRLPAGTLFSSLVPFKTLTYEYLSLLRRSTLLIASSKFVATLVRWLYGLDVNAVVYPPVDTETFDFTRGMPNADSIVLYTGSRVVDTRLDVVGKVVESIIELADLGSIRQVTLVGEQSYRPIKEPNSRIVFRGLISDDRRLARLYSEARATVAPQTAEGFGYVPVESMSCGTPAVCLDSPALNEHVPAETIAHSASSISELISNLTRFVCETPSPTKRLQCRQWAQEHYALQNSLSALATALQPT